MELQKFKNEEFGEIRTLDKNGVVWFVGKDVASILGYERGAKAIQDHVDDEDKDAVPIQDSIGRKQNTPIINESGLYSLILSSKLPAAKAFKRWVTSEVLPSIRKTGGYSKQPVKNEQQEQRAKAMLLNAQSRQCKLWLQLAATTDLPDYKHICQQKAAEALTGASVLPMQEAEQKTYSATEIGKQLGVTAHKIGLLANKHSLKNETYGKYFYDKSAYSNKQVETFRYYPNAIDKFKELLGGAAK